MISNEIKTLLAKRFLVEINSFSINVEEIHAGIIFLYAFWSQSLLQLKVLVNSLQQFDDAKLYVIDVDEPRASEFIDRNHLESNGWGETYWIKNGEITFKAKKYDLSYLIQLHERNLFIQS
jgi:hypothetical protein